MRSDDPGSPGATAGIHVVAIGASAGGLEALKRLLSGLSPEPAAAIVVVQHLDPNRASMMASLLQRQTKLDVVEAASGPTPLEPGTVYTIKPGQIPGIEGRNLVLKDASEDRHRRAPVDIFFRSLAESFGEEAVAVLLSGTGTDGSQGVRDVKAAGGLVMVQAPDDADFGGMPQAAIDTGVVDFVGSAEDVADSLERWFELAAGDSAAPARGRALAAEAADQETEGLAGILARVNEVTGHDFRTYKPATLRRRIRRRMGLAGAGDEDVYRRLLDDSDEEARQLSKDLLIGVTRFFRDPEVWHAFAEKAIDPAIHRLGDGETLRVWVAGCATGEEAYTVAMLATDRIERSNRRIHLQLFATDLDPRALETARAARYPLGSASDVPRSFHERFLHREEDTVRVSASLRERIVFAAQNAVSDPPFSSLDLITCRNLLIYLNEETQARLLETFQFALRDRGFLLLGLAESAERAETSFAPVSKRHRIYLRSGDERRLPRHTLQSSRARRDEHSGGAGAPNLPVDRVTRTMLARFVPAAVLVDSAFNVQTFHGDLGDYLGYRPGVMTGNLITMADDALQARLYALLEKVRQSQESDETVIRSVRRGPARADVRVIVDPVRGTGGARLFLVFFEDLAEREPGPPPPVEQDAPAGEGYPALVADLQAELAAVRRELQDTIEAAETSKEELQASNEEVMGANEELQSSNEELETSREELQSLNQELTTLNNQLEEKIAEVEAANDDLANLIASTDVAMLFLDTDLRIRRFSDRMNDLASLRETDVGRPLADLSLKVDDPELLAEAGTVLARLGTLEAEVAGPDGSFFIRRIVPYRTRHDRIDGVVVTFSDITGIKRSARRMEAQGRRQASIAELGELALATEDLQALLDRAATELTERLVAPFVEIQEADPQGYFRLIAGAGWARGLVGKTRTPSDLLNHAGYSLRRTGPVLVSDFRSEERFATSPLLADHDITCGMVSAIGPAGEPWGVVGVWRDEPCPFEEEEASYLQAVANILWLAVAQHRTRSAREAERRELRQLMDGLPIMIGVLDRDLTFEIGNGTFEALGWTEAELEGRTLGEIVSEDALEAARPALEAALAGDRASAEVALPIPGGKPRGFLIHVAPRIDGAGVDGVFVAMIDIEERRQAEERKAIISAELDHRVKNILALVTTIARMTGRRATSIEAYTAAFQDRIASLARTHSALAEGDWTGMELGALVRSELEAYGVDGERVSVGGDRVEFDRVSTQSLALAIHELTTNAVKYGALSIPEGRLSVHWQRSDEEVTITWTEDGLKDVAAPETAGFGRRVIESAVGTQLGGRVGFDFRGSGLVCTLALPLPDRPGADGAARHG